MVEKLIKRACFLEFYCRDRGIKTFAWEVGMGEFDVVFLISPCLVAHNNELEAVFAEFTWVEIPLKLCGLDEVQLGREGGTQAKLLGERTGAMV